MAVSSENLRRRAPAGSWDWRAVVRLAAISRALDDLEESILLPERKVLYEDPDLGFTILAHGYVGAKGSKPHDHGPSWAIYGQADGETIMTDWDCLERSGEGKTGKARWVRDYAMRPGDAYLYDVGVLHSPRREGSTRLLRIEGINMEKVKRFPYEAVTEAQLSTAAE